MKILPAAQNDVPQLISLWMEAFGEEKEEVLPFFREIFPLCRPFCVKDGDTVCAMAYALPQTMHTPHGDLPMAYFYAVATKKEYRGKGLASKLLDGMAATLQKEGFAGVLLVPANLPLFEFYAKCGFAPFSYRAFATVTASDAPAQELSAAEYAALRKTYLPGIHNVPPAAVLEHLRRFSFPGGCAAAEKTERGIILREILGDIAQVGGVVAAMGEADAKVHLPTGETPYAVCRPLTEDFPKEGYFAFAME